MSLDVYLRGPDREERCVCAHCFTEHVRIDADELYWANITHNLGKMAAAAGLYRWLWRPEEMGVSVASELVGPLEVGLLWLESDPDRFRPLNAANGWGVYEDFLRFVRDYLKACREHPTGRISVSR